VGVEVGRFGVAVGWGRGVDVAVGVGGTVGVEVGMVPARLVGVTRLFAGVWLVGVTLGGEAAVLPPQPATPRRQTGSKSV
jgi:hypothetical protein